MNNETNTYSFLILTFFFSGCANTRKREAVDRLQGTWVTDWTLTEPLMEDAIRAAVTRNPGISEQSLRETLTEFHKNQKFEFSGNAISPGQDKWGAYKIVKVQKDGIVIREF